MHVAPVRRGKSTLIELNLAEHLYEGPMSDNTFTSAGNSYKITVNPGPSGDKRFPMILLVHGNFGLGRPYGDQIHGSAKDLAARGYVTAVPQYFQDDSPHLSDTSPHDRTLADAVAAIAKARMQTSTASASLGTRWAPRRQ